MVKLEFRSIRELKMYIEKMQARDLCRHSRNRFARVNVPSRNGFLMEDTILQIVNHDEGPMLPGNAISVSVWEIDN